MDVKDFYCPIFKELMCDPVLASDGHFYERDAITDWYKSNKNSPITREPINDNFISSILIKNAIDNYISKNPELAKERYQMELSRDKLYKIVYEDKNAKKIFYYSNCLPLMYDNLDTVLQILMNVDTETKKIIYDYFKNLMNSDIFLDIIDKVDNTELAQEIIINLFDMVNDISDTYNYTYKILECGDVSFFEYIYVRHQFLIPKLLTKNINLNKCTNIFESLIVINNYYDINIAKLVIEELKKQNIKFNKELFKNGNEIKNFDKKRYPYLLYLYEIYSDEYSYLDETKINMCLFLFYETENISNHLSFFKKILAKRIFNVKQKNNYLIISRFKFEDIETINNSDLIFFVGDSLSLFIEDIFKKNNVDLIENYISQLLDNDNINIDAFDSDIIMKYGSPYLINKYLDKIKHPQLEFIKIMFENKNLKDDDREPLIKRCLTKKRKY